PVQHVVDRNPKIANARLAATLAGINRNSLRAFVAHTELQTPNVHPSTWFILPKKGGSTLPPPTQINARSMGSINEDQWGQTRLISPPGWHRLLKLSSQDRTHGSSSPLCVARPAAARHSAWQ